MAVNARATSLPKPSAAPLLATSKALNALSKFLIAGINLPT